MNKFNEGDLVRVVKSVRKDRGSAEGRYGDYFIDDVGVFRFYYSEGTTCVVDFPPSKTSEDRSNYDVDEREIAHADKLTKLLMGVEND